MSRQRCKDNENGGGFLKTRRELIKIKVGGGLKLKKEGKWKEQWIVESKYNRATIYESIG